MSPSGDKVCYDLKSGKETAAETAARFELTTPQYRGVLSSHCATLPQSWKNFASFTKDYFWEAKVMKLSKYLVLSSAKNVYFFG